MTTAKSEAVRIALLLLERKHEYSEIPLDCIAEYYTPSLCAGRGGSMDICGGGRRECRQGLAWAAN